MVAYTIKEVIFYIGGEILRIMIEEVILMKFLIVNMVLTG